MAITLYEECRVGAGFFPDGSVGNGLEMVFPLPLEYTGGASETLLPKGIWGGGLWMVTLLEEGDSEMAVLLLHLD